MKALLLLALLAGSCETNEYCKCSKELQHKPLPLPPSFEAKQVVQFVFCENRDDSNRIMRMNDCAIAKDGSLCDLGYRETYKHKIGEMLYCTWEK